MTIRLANTWRTEEARPASEIDHETWRAAALLACAHATCPEDARLLLEALGLVGYAGHAKSHHDSDPHPVRRICRRVPLLHGWIVTHHVRIGE